MEDLVLASDGVDTGVRVSITDNAATLTDADTGEPFVLGDAPFVLHPSGHDVRIASNGAWLRHDGERWSTSDEPQAFQLYAPGEAQGQACCCGPAGRHAVDLEWEEYRHEDLVSEAARVAKAVIGKTAPNAAHAQAFRDKYWINKLTDFAVKAIDGLQDADKKAEYTGTAPILGHIYYKHFYDPDLRSTFFSYTENGMTEFCRHFYASLHARERGDLNAAGYALGLALHYLTDLTQPMHAANFINMQDFGDWRHTGFEKEADKARYDHAGDAIDVSAEDLGRWRSPGQIVTEVATFSKRVFQSDVAAVAAKKETYRNEGGVTFRFYDNVWKPEEVQPIIDKMFPYALKMTATFFLYWTATSTYAQIDNLFTRILGRPAGNVDDSGLQTWGGHLRSGQTMHWVVRNLALSDESIANIKAAGSVDDQIRVMYRRFLGREAGEADLQHWRGWVGGGLHADTIKGLVDSAEYAQKFGPHVLPY